MLPCILKNLEFDQNLNQLDEIRSSIIWQPNIDEQKNLEIVQEIELEDMDALEHYAHQSSDIRKELDSLAA